MRCEKGAPAQACRSANHGRRSSRLGFPPALLPRIAADGHLSVDEVFGARRPRHQRTRGSYGLATRLLRCPQAAGGSRTHSGRNTRINLTRPAVSVVTSDCSPCGVCAVCHVHPAKGDRGFYGTVSVGLCSRRYRTGEATRARPRRLLRIIRARLGSPPDCSCELPRLGRVPAGCADDGGQHAGHRADHAGHRRSPPRRLDDPVFSRLAAGTLRLDGIARLHRLQRGDVLLRTAVQLVLPPVRRVARAVVLGVGDARVAVRPLRGERKRHRHVPGPSRCTCWCASSSSP